MKLNKKDAQIFVPDNTEVSSALARTTSLCIAAHQDDIEIMAFGPIAACFGEDNKWFTGVVVTDGAGSPRCGVYEKFSDDEMKTVRAQEQITAASIGKYSAQLLLAYTSSDVKDPASDTLVLELKSIIEQCKPDVIYTHNLADKHDTHVAVALRVISAVRLLDDEYKPKQIISLEVWRGLDWLCDADKTVMDTSCHQNLAAALLGVFDSQIAGGKRYDLAALGRRASNATFFASHDVDSSDSMIYGMDITGLAGDASQSPEAMILAYIDRFKDEVITRIARFK